MCACLYACARVCGCVLIPKTHHISDADMIFFIFFSWMDPIRHFVRMFQVFDEKKKMIVVIRNKNYFFIKGEKDLIFFQNIE